MRASPRLGTVVLLLACAAPASAAPGPRFAERLTGYIFPDPTDGATRKAITLDLRCFSQQPGDSSCDGTYRCRRAPRLTGFPPPPPRCAQKQARISFVIDDLPAACLGPGTEDATLTSIVYYAEFPDGVRCRFSGVGQRLLSVAVNVIPSLQGRYECRDAPGEVVESGIFSLRLDSLRRLPID